MSYTCAYCKQPYTEQLSLTQVVCSEKCRDAYHVLQLEKEIGKLRERLRLEREWRAQDREASRRIISDLEHRLNEEESYRGQVDEEYPSLAVGWVSKRRYPPVA